MKAIIIGAGKVGFSIAQLLSKEDHDVVIIEQSPERQEILEETLDVQVIGGFYICFVGGRGPQHRYASGGDRI